MSQVNPKEIIEKGILQRGEFTQVQQVGIDLTLSEDVKIPHGHSYNALLNEIVVLPLDIFATFTHRSSFNRKGIFITGSIYDPGYNGQIGCTIYNLSGAELTIPKNERIGQMLFFRAEAASEYSGQYQKEHLMSAKEKETLERRNRKSFPDNY